MLGVDKDALGARHRDNLGVAIGVAAVVNESCQPALHAAHGAIHCSTTRQSYLLPTLLHPVRDVCPKAGKISHAKERIRISP